ncbi:uncharacterized protein LOC132732128 [Ruditapes philippinarum]|uniref:uncharacterized protein LOC132732128 n=1 Tax=Ruditapes philippinarum TaxID=129788 RepID=UPI00295A998F|nr:uncharacterized protein LOC132732128 [Ruditapes philippinarum]
MATVENNKAPTNLINNGRTLPSRSSVMTSSKCSVPSSLRSSRIDLLSSRRSTNFGSSPTRRLSSFRVLTSPIRDLTSPVRVSNRFYKSNLTRKASKRSLITAVMPNELETTNDNIALVPEELEILLDRCNKIEKTAIQNMKKVEQSHAAVTADIKKYRKQVNNVLDVWEKEALERVNGIMDLDIAHLSSVLDEVTKLAEEILQSAKDVTEYKSKLFEVNVIETEAKNTYREYKFVSNETISNLLKTETELGDIEITHEVAGLYNNLKAFDNFVPTYLEEINVKAENDTFDCDITGMTMIGNHKLFLTDTDNKSIKSVDTKLKKITSYLSLSSGPWDLTVVHRGQLAVTLPNEKIIQFVLTTGGLTKDRHMKVNGECHGITYRRECLIVSFRSPGKVQIMTLQGRALKIINQDLHKARLFDWPDYIAVSKDGNYIYVSDWHRNTVTRLSWKGEVTGVYKDSLGTKMAGVAVANDGSVFVCKRTSHSIVKLSPNLSVSNTILEEKHGLKYPWSLCFCDEESKLYVDNNRNSNTVAVFELR